MAKLSSSAEFPLECLARQKASSVSSAKAWRLQFLNCLLFSGLWNVKSPGAISSLPNKSHFFETTWNSAYLLTHNSSMYRAYACGVGLPQRHDELHWQKFLKDSHYRRMREMKPAIDNKVQHDINSRSHTTTYLKTISCILQAPLKFPHLQSNLKKLQVEHIFWLVINQVVGKASGSHVLTDGRSALHLDWKG